MGLLTPMMHRQAICIAERFGSDSFFASASSWTEVHIWPKTRGSGDWGGTVGGRGGIQRIPFEVQDYARVYETAPLVGRNMIVWWGISTCTWSSWCGGGAGEIGSAGDEGASCSCWESAGESTFVLVEPLVIYSVDPVAI